MRVFFDNCTSPTLADTLNGYLQHCGHSAIHIKDAPCGRSAPDIEWIAMLGAAGETWIVMTGDGRIHRNKAERAAYRQAMLRGFVLAPAFKKMPTNETAAILIWRWPEMEALVAQFAGAALFELPIKRTSKFRSLPL